MYIPISLSSPKLELGERELKQYLKRIGASYDHLGELRYLNHLHHRHLLSVPFENYDIVNKIHIELEWPNLFDKIIIRKRGGFCYELNYMFSWMLKNTFYEVDLISANVYSRGKFPVNDSNLPKSTFDLLINDWVAGKLGQNFDHLCLIINTSNGKYLADVGFGGLFIHPLKIEIGVVTEQRSGTWRIVDGINNKYILEKFYNNIWLPIYKFSTTTYDIKNFSQMLNYHSTSPKSTFTQFSQAQILTENGRASFNGNMLSIKKENLIVSQKEVSIEEFKYYLEHIFDFLPSEIEQITNGNYFL
ncbi:MAG: arylamine N-acetyltransferase [Chlorobiota bacterium]|nr:arylamine N-acetyltransferase [Chlorobiota bacterium]QQS66787.1 MAG: arylamine N-acetyltransferase [Chlorobiota bacterium]